MIKYQICIILICLILFGCSRDKNTDETFSAVTESTAEEQEIPDAEKNSRIVFAMDTVMEITVYSNNDDVLNQAEDKIAELENKLSVTLPNSEIYSLNENGTCVLSDETAFLLAAALELCGSTNGALDITVYPVVQAWGFNTGEYRIPSDSELSTLLENVDYSSVVLDKSSAAIPEGVRVDLGSVAKGYTGDVICDLLKENGISSALLNLGGNVQALGSKPDGTPWRIAVRHPTDTSNYLGVLEISNMAAITSGGYERYFVGEDGKTYWHIIDPSDGKPADSGILSVTVVGESGVLCDALSTALFVMGIDEASDYYRTHEGFELIFVTYDGSVYITEGLIDSFTLSEDYADTALFIIER